MDLRKNQPRGGACNQYKWDPVSAGRKAISNSTINMGPVKKTVPPHNPNSDAFRNCANCGKHFNYHKKK